VRAGGVRTGTLTIFTTDTTDDSGSGIDISRRRLLLSPAAGVAWLLRSVPFTPSASGTPVFTRYGCVLSTRAVCAPRQLATGAIDAASLQLAGTTLSWSASGQSQSASLSG